MGKSSGKKKKPTAAAAATATATTTTTNSISTTTPSPPPNGIHLDVSLLLKRAHELKEEGNRLFQSKDYAGALQQYDLALKLTPRNHPDRAVFHSNRAACLMQMRPVDHEAVAAECSLALQAQPRFPRALLRRARAFEALRRYDLALDDVHALLAIDPSHRDALELSRRLRATVSPARTAFAAVDATSRPSPAALGASAVRVAAPVVTGLGLGPSLPARPGPKKPSAINSKLPSSLLAEKPANSTRSTSPPRVKPIPPSNPAVTQPKDSVLDGSKVQLTVRKTSCSDKWRPLKLVYDHDIRLAQMPAGCNFRVLREVVSKRFPSSKSVLIKYKDADGDLVTITSTPELRLAESSLDELASKEKKDGVEMDIDAKLQVLRLHIVEVNSEQEPPLPEEEEEDEGLVKGDESLSNSLAGDSLQEATDNDVARMDMEENAVEEKVTAGKKECGHAECKEVEIDDWLFEFAQLFRNQVGIDPDAHLDLHELGMELCSEALEETVTSEDAQGLFEMAAAKFQEVAALAFFNWGNVHMCAARKRIPLDETSPKEVMSAQLRIAYDWVRERYALAAEKYEEALRIKPDFYEGLLALGQQNFETAKLHWSFALADKVDLSTWDSSETINLFDSAEEKMKAATDMWEKVEEQRMAELKDPGLNKKDAILKKRKKQGLEDSQPELTADEAAEQATVMRSQIHLFWGNMLFERSQVEFKLGFSNWKKNLDEAIDRFQLAGASEADISVVLKNHSSNEAVAECEEKKVMSLSVDASGINANGEDKYVLDS
ncbi:protein CLMP1 [Typha latifolia]|uniref:protein CLMP1 n=1 Tax=Typha latifolia TaxID=4733 RepID=UPI003C3033E2